MCEPSRKPSRSITAAGEARRQSLLRWVANDLANGDRTLAGALELWRDEVVTRLQGRNGVTRLRIPGIFVSTLHLDSPFVLLYDDGAVCAIGPKENGKYFPGPVLLFGTDRN